MMLDGIKLKLDSYSIRQLISNPNLEFKSQVNRQTGEVGQTQIWMEKGITIYIKNSGYGLIKGSLHKFKNGGYHNYDDFTWNQVSNAILDLSDTIGIDISQLKLENLEWGLNIETNIPPKEIIGGLVIHRGVEFKKMYVFPGTHSLCQHAQFGIKVYDKGKESLLSKNLIRLEISANKSVFFNRLGIHSLHDIGNDEVRANLQNSLIYGVWKDTILIDPMMMQYHPLTSKDSERMAKWSNPNFWIRSTKQIREYNKKAYENFRREKGFETKEIFFQKMIQKVKQL